MSSKKIPEEDSKKVSTNVIKLAIQGAGLTGENNPPVDFKSYMAGKPVAEGDRTAIASLQDTQANCRVQCTDFSFEFDATLTVRLPYRDSLITLYSDFVLPDEIIDFVNEHPLELVVNVETKVDR